MKKKYSICAFVTGVLLVLGGSLVGQDNEVTEALEGVFRAREGWESVRMLLETPATKSATEIFLTDIDDMKSQVTLTEYDFGKVKIDAVGYVDNEGLELVYIPSAKQIVLLRGEERTVVNHFADVVTDFLLRKSDLAGFSVEIARFLKDWRITKDKGIVTLEAKYTKELNEFLDPKEKLDYDFNIKFDTANSTLTSYSLGQRGALLETKVKILSTNPEEIVKGLPKIPKDIEVSKGVTFVDVVKSLLTK